MKLLNTKIQLNICEKGEFIDEEYRSEEEVYNLLENFDWAGERKKLRISNTNPSITIEDDFGNFLKIAVFYNNKFVVRYLDVDKKIYYIKSITTIKESFKYINTIFNGQKINTTHLRKERGNFNKIYQHFATSDFEYTYSAKKGYLYLLKTSHIHLLFGLILIFLALRINPSEQLLGTSVIAYSSVAFIFFILGGGINLLLFWRFRINSKNKYLKMSKSRSVFYYGDLDNINEYNKDDINRCEVIRNNASRSPIYEFIIFRIYFNDNSFIQIPNTLIDEYIFLNKLHEKKIVYKNRYPIFKSKR